MKWELYWFYVHWFLKYFDKKSLELPKTICYLTKYLKIEGFTYMPSKNSLFTYLIPKTLYLTHALRSEAFRSSLHRLPSHVGRRCRYIFLLNVSKSLVLIHFFTYNQNFIWVLSLFMSICLRGSHYIAWLELEELGIHKYMLSSLSLLDFLDF